MGVFAVGVDMALSGAPVRLRLKTKSSDGEGRHGFRFVWAVCRAPPLFLVGESFFAGVVVPT